MEEDFRYYKLNSCTKSATTRLIRDVQYNGEKMRKDRSKFEEISQGHN